MGTVLKTAPGVILGGIVLAGLGLGGYYLLQPSQGSSGSGQVSETPDTADAAREVKLTKANAVLARFCLDSLGRGVAVRPGLLTSSEGGGHADVRSHEQRG